MSEYEGILMEKVILIDFGRNCITVYEFNGRVIIKDGSEPNPYRAQIKKTFP